MTNEDYEKLTPEQRKHQAQLDLQNILLSSMGACVTSISVNLNGGPDGKAPTPGPLLNKAQLARLNKAYTLLLDVSDNYVHNQPFKTSL